MAEKRYPNNLKRLESDQEAPQNYCPERMVNHGVPADGSSEGMGAIAERQGASENNHFEAKQTQSKTNVSSGLDINRPYEKQPWFSEGLRFKCTGCGKCCSGSPGYVFLTPDDLQRLAIHFSLSFEEFAAKYTYKVDDKISLIDQPGSSSCVFLKDNQCSVYEARPVQCQTFPWWIHFLETPEDWEEAGKRCEGINHPEAPIVPSLIIQQQCFTYLDNLLEQNFSLSP